MKNVRLSHDARPTPAPRLPGNPRAETTMRQGTARPELQEPRAPRKKTGSQDDAGDSLSSRTIGCRQPHSARQDDSPASAILQKALLHGAIWFSALSSLPRFSMLFSLQQTEAICSVPFLPFHNRQAAYCAAAFSCVMARSSRNTVSPSERMMMRYFSASSKSLV